MVESIVKDEKRLIPAAAYLNGEYGHQGIFLGGPILLGRKGVEIIIKLDLSEEEKRALNRSAQVVREGVKTLDSLSL